MASSAQSLITTAVASGYDALSNRDLKECLLVAAQAGGELAGLGSPQGVVSAIPGQTYLDTSGGHFWAKQTGINTNTGWLMLV